MRVVADTYALAWYLLDDRGRRLSSAALAAPEEAESTDGIAVSVASVVDLGHLIRTRGTFTGHQLDQVVPTLRSRPSRSLSTSRQPSASSPAMRSATHGTRFINATAMALALPLVTRDRRITDLGLVETVW